MNILHKLFGKKEVVPSWEEALANGFVYPQESISLVSFQTKNGTGTGWIDKSYLKYPYKKICRHNILIEVDLSDEVALKNPDLDMATIEDFLIDELRKVSIAHAIYRLVNETGMTLEFYVEKKDESETILKMASNDPNRLFSFSYKISEDPWWTAVQPFLKTK